jgi:uncharacterized Tic20 family protein
MKKFLRATIIVRQIYFFVLVCLLTPLQFANATHELTVEGVRLPHSTQDRPSGPSSLQNPLAFDSLAEFLEALLRIIIQIGFPFLVLAVIYTGFLFVSAQGNTEKLQKARTAFFYTVIGALIILAAAAIAELIQGTVDQITN